jgi:hypothetical protein
VHRPALEGVVEILAVRGGAVDHRGVLRAEGARVADRGACAPAVDARDQRAHVVGSARGHAQARHVDQQVFAARADGRRELFRRKDGDLLDEPLGDRC